MNTLFLKRKIANRCPRCGGEGVGWCVCQEGYLPVCHLKYDRGEDGFFLGGLRRRRKLLPDLHLLDFRRSIRFFDIFPWNGCSGFA